MTIKDIKPGVGDLSDLHVENLSRVDENQEGNVYVQKQATQVEPVEEGYVPTHVSYKPVCWGVLDLPLYFQVALETDVETLEAEPLDHRNTIVKEVSDGFDGWGDAGYPDTENFVYSEPLNNTFNDTLWTFNSADSSSEYVVGDGSVTNIDTFPDETVKNMGDYPFRMNDAAKHIRCMCIQPKADYTRHTFGLKTDVNLPHGWLHDDTTTPEPDGRRLTFSVMARWEGLKSSEGVAFFLWGRDTDGKAYWVYDRKERKRFVAFGKRIGNANYVVDEFDNGDWIGGSQDISNWQQYIFNVDFSNLVVLGGDIEYDDDGLIPEQTFIDNEIAGAGIEIHFLSVNWKLLEDWLKGLSTAPELDDPKDLFRIHGKVWLGEFKMFSNTGHARYELGLGNKCTTTSIGRVFDQPLVTFGDMTKECKFSSGDEREWIDEFGNIDSHLTPSWNADTDSIWNPVLVDDHIRTLAKHAYRSYKYINMTGATKKSAIKLDKYVSSGDISTTDNIVSTGVSGNVISAEWAGGGDPFEISFWINNYDLSDGTLDLSGGFYVGQHSFMTSQLPDGVEVKVGIYDVGTSIERHAFAHEGDVYAGNNAEPEPADRFFRTAQHPGDGGRYANLKVTITAAPVDPGSGAMRVYILSHDMSPYIPKLLELIPNDVGLVPNPGQATEFKGTARAYPIGITKKINIPEIDRVQYHPICLDVYATSPDSTTGTDAHWYVDLLNTFGTDKTFTAVDDDTISYSVHGFDRPGYDTHKYLTSIGSGGFETPNKSFITFANRTLIGTGTITAVLNNPNVVSVGNYAEYSMPLSMIGPFPPEVYEGIEARTFQVLPQIESTGSTTFTDGWTADSPSAVKPSYIYDAADKRMAHWQYWTEPYLDRANSDVTLRPGYWGPGDKRNWYRYLINPTGAVENIVCVDGHKIDQDGNPIPGYHASEWDKYDIRVPICEGPSPDNAYSFIMRSDMRVDATRTWNENKFEIGNWNVSYTSFDTLYSWIVSQSVDIGGAATYYKSVTYRYSIDGGTTWTQGSKWVLPVYKIWKSNVKVIPVDIEFGKISRYEFDNQSSLFQYDDWDGDNNGIIIVNHSERFSIFCNNPYIKAWVDEDREAESFDGIYQGEPSVDTTTFDPNNPTYSLFCTVDTKGDYLWQPRVHSGWYLINNQEGFFYALEQHQSITNNTDTEITMAAPSPRHEAPIFIDAGAVLQLGDTFPMGLDIIPDLDDPDDDGDGDPDDDGVIPDDDDIPEVGRDIDSTEVTEGIETDPETGETSSTGSSVTFGHQHLEQN
jgi:hypothetical protein